MIRNFALVILTLALLRQSGRSSDLEKRVADLEVALGKTHFNPEVMT